MLVDELVIAETTLGVAFFIYNFVMFYFADVVLVKPRVPRQLRFVAVLANTLLFVAMVHNGVAVPMEYFVIFSLLYFEFIIFYKSKILQTVFMVSVYTLHVMAMRTISVAIFSIVTNIPFYGVTKSPFLFTWATIAVILFLIVTTILLKKLVRARSLRILTQNKDQFVFIAIWSFICNLYLYTNSWVFVSVGSYSFLNVLEISSSMAILITQYILLFFALKTSSLLGYKERNTRLEHEISMEQQYRGSIVNDAITYYEFNLTNNTISLEMEKYPEIISQEIADNYSAVTNLLASRLVHADDLHSVHQYSSEKNLMNIALRGAGEVSIEYRRINENGSYIWVMATTNLVIDKTNGAIKGFTYIKDIDHKKKKQIELKEKAERDVLTGLYNKSMTGMLIGDYLIENAFGDEKNAVIIVDVDNFKTVNDSLGHTFGDAVLCELAEKLKKIFRNNDIIGRIGGDEFMAFMANIKDYEILNEKARLICDNFRNSYEGNTGEAFTVSSSIGIAIAPQHGVTFDELYQHADVALYNSKNSGKDTFTIYDGEAFVGYQSNRTQIDSMIAASQKGFRDNRIEYIFNILYGSDTSTFAIGSILELLAKHFHFSRGYVYESDRGNTVVSNTFEWCDRGIESQRENQQYIPISTFKVVADTIKREGVYILSDLSTVEESERIRLESVGVQFSIQFGVFENDGLRGIIGFDDCTKKRNLLSNTISEIATICNVFALFIIKQRAMEEAHNNFAVLSEIMDRLDSFSYVVSKETRQLLFVNRRTKELAGDIQIGDKCYSSFRDEKSICQDCPINRLNESFDSKCVMEIYNKKFDMWIESAATYVKWINGETACLINCVDITKYKKAPMP